MKVFAFLYAILIGLIGLCILMLLLYLIFLNHITTIYEMVRLVAIITPLLILMSWAATKATGYAFTDEGVSVGKVGNNNVDPNTYIKWEDATRIEHKPSYIKVLSTGKITIYSNVGTKVAIPDSQREFQEILSTVREKAEMHDIPFVTK